MLGEKGDEISASAANEVEEGIIEFIQISQALQNEYSRNPICAGENIENEISVNIYNSTEIV